MVTIPFEAISDPAMQAKTNQPMMEPDKHALASPGDQEKTRLQYQANSSSLRQRFETWADSITVGQCGAPPPNEKTSSLV